MTLKYYLPKNTQKLFLGENNNAKCSNLSLLINRYYGYEQDPKKEKSEKIDFFKSITKPFNDKLIENIYRRWQTIVNSYIYSETFTASPEWRMVVGLGQTSILETSMTLDRITGIPIIPGSALKGLAASYAMLCHLNTTDRNEAEKDVTFKAIFGTQETEGKVIFFDAVPTKAPKLEPDIMNNHYPDYYQGTSAPTPYQNPNPVYFLTLGRDSQFAFAVAGKNNKVEQELVTQAKEWLQNGLKDMGIGAKTAAGYGYLTIS